MSWNIVQNSPAGLTIVSEDNVYERNDGVDVRHTIVCVGLREEARFEHALL